MHTAVSFVVFKHNYKISVANQLWLTFWKETIVSVQSFQTERCILLHEHYFPHNLISWCHLNDSSCPKAEVVARRPRPCGKTEFTCSNHRCIPIQLQCDLFGDCGDGSSDEQDCKACKCSIGCLEQTDQSASLKRYKVPSVTEMFSDTLKSHSK